MTGALFHTEKDNARETVNGVLASGAAYQVEGIDLEVSGKITDRWSVFGGLVLMRSKVTQLALASNIGLQMANIAHKSFSMLTKYKFDNGWELGGQAVYRSKIFRGTFGANTGTELPSYWQFDAFVEKKIDKNWTMKLYAQNLTNKLYYDTLYRSATPFVAVAPGGRSTWSRRRSSDCADLYSRGAEQKRCGGLPPHHGRERLGRRPIDRRRAVRAGHEQLSPDSEVAR